MLLTLAVVGALAWSAWSARREHRRAAEETVRDYATFAAGLAAANVESAMERVLLYAFYGADLAERQRSNDPVSPRVLATNPAEVDRCATMYPDGRWFARVAADGAMKVEGALDPEVGRWLADTLVALQQGPSGERYGNLFPSVGNVPVIAYRFQRDSAGGIVAAHALAHCYESAGGSVFDEARRTALLPPTKSRGSDTLVMLTVADLRGSIVHRSPASGEATFTGTRPSDIAGPLQGLTFSVGVPARVAQDLVAGGIPGRRDGTWILVVLAATLGVATIVQVKRSMALVQARERFVANVSHELRTPLQSILLFSQLLRMERAGSAAERAEAIRVIEREAERLIGLVERVLAFAGGRAADGPAEEARSVDLAQVVGETVEAFRPLARSGDVRLTVEIPRDLPAVRGDSRALRQVLFNLLDNAVRYGPVGQRVDVRAVARNGAVEILVEDEGPGIPPHERERVWKPFVRLERNGTHGGEAGSGIGLAVVHDAVEAMGGRAWIEGGEGAGTRVVVRLRVDPRAPKDVEA
ncbi:MAG TPA: HAMP domain-containing sensor histidine kinase [Gemmatimonadaceae bacterium]|nr:HAMP domain-containing sensor histidine kinase [Gemmatimonadaceae bacterium]